MVEFLVDVNLPRRFSLWNDPKYIHQYDINDESKDSDIWIYSKNRNLTIITKDSDFSDLILYEDPPPKVIHVKVGNLKIQPLSELLKAVWPEVLELNETHKLVNIFIDRIEAVK